MPPKMMKAPLPPSSAAAAHDLHPLPWNAPMVHNMLPWNAFMMYNPLAPMMYNSAQASNPAPAATWDERQRP